MVPVISCDNFHILETCRLGDLIMNAANVLAGIRVCDINLEISNLSKEATRVNYG